MFKMKNLTCALLFTSIAMLLLALKPPSVSAVPAITAYMDPPAIVFGPSDAVGTLFNVTFWINSTESFNLMMFQVFLTYNDSIINMTRGWPNMVSLDNWDPDYVFNGKGGMGGNPTYYDAAHSPVGYAGVMLGHTLLADQSIPAATPKKLVIVEFNITQVPSDGQFSCGFVIDYPSPYGSFFYDSLGEITVSRNGGTYTYVPEPILMLLSIVMIASIVTVGVVKIKTRKSRFPSTI
jgi:hypothetical protein